MKRLPLILLFLFIPFIAHSAVVTESYESPDGVTVKKLETNRLALTNAANSIDGSLIQDESITTAELDDNANPENRWNEGFNDFVYTGLLPPTSTTLTTVTTSGTAYVDGVRVVKDATSHTYTLSKHTYLDLASNGTYTYNEVTIGAAEPSTTANSIRLALVSTDATKVLSVTDDRVTTITLAAGSVGSIADTDGDTQIQTEESSDEDILRFDTAGSERMTIGATGNVIVSGTLSGGSLGVGTTAPTKTMEIVGDIEVSGTGNFGTLTIGETLVPSYGDTRYDVISFTRDSAIVSGTQVVSGLTFTPTAVTCFSGAHGAVGETSWGMSDGTTHGVLADGNNVNAGTYFVGTELIANYEAASINTTAVATSFNSTGMVLTWTTSTTAPTGTLTIKAKFDR